jgi:transcriptional regulator with XRE-family HTH domain
MNDTIADRLRQARKERGLSQQGLAERSGISASFIARIEQRRGYPSVTNVFTLAEALGVEPSRLLDRRERLGESGRDRGILGVRDALLAAGDLPGLDVGGDGTPVPVADLERDVSQGWEFYWSGRLGALAAALPSLIIAARATEREHGGTACKPLAQAYQLAADLLVHCGDDNLALAAAMRAVFAANRGDDPLQHATLGGCVSWVLLHQGRLGDAERVAAAAAVKIEPSGRVPVEHLTVYGSLLLSAAAAAATAGNAGAVQSYMAEAGVTALRFTEGDRHDFRTNFGPTQVAMQKTYQMAVLGESGGALKAARRVNRADLLRISWGAHQLDVAQASLDMKRVSATVDALWAAHAVSPEWARHQGLFRTLVLGALHAENRLSDRTRKLRDAAGLG